MHSNYVCLAGNALHFTFILLKTIYFMSVLLIEVYILLLSRCKIVNMRTAKAMGNLRIGQAHLNNHYFAIQ